MSGNATDTDERPILDGTVVIDFSEGLAGPVATRLLAELGARVIKVEVPAGDFVRSWDPAAFANWNRSKESIVLDLHEAPDRDQAIDLIRGADVVVHSWSADQVGALGVDALLSEAEQAGAILATVDGSPVGPLAELPPREILAQAWLGIMDEQEGNHPGPFVSRMPLANWSAALLLASGVLARLFERERTGASGNISTSLVQGALVTTSLYWQRASDPPEWLERHTLPKYGSPPTRCLFRCADDRWIQLHPGHVRPHVGGDSVPKRRGTAGSFLQAPVILEVLEEMGLTELFNTPVTEENQPRWAEVMVTRARDEWTELLWSNGIMCMPILDVGEALTLEQARANAYVSEVVDPELGATLQAGQPLGVQPPARVTSPAPRLGQHEQRLPSPKVQTPNTLVPDPTAPMLAGITVLDFGSFVAGPFAGQCLADFGADVIKIESPSGEKGRFINQFTACHRGERGLSLDLGKPGSQEILKRLIQRADVVMHNVREMSQARIGLDEASVRAIKPDVIFANSSAFGRYGPWKDLPGFDAMGMALSGWTLANAGGGRPLWMRGSLVDSNTGLLFFAGIVAALLHRQRDGAPTRVDASLLGTSTLFTSETVLTGEPAQAVAISPIDEQHLHITPSYGVYKTADGYIALAAVLPSEIAGAEEALGALEIDTITEVCAGLKTAELLRRLTDHAVPATEVNLSHRDAFFDQELARNSGLVQRLETQDYGWFENPAGFWFENGRPVVSERPIPAVGQHTEEILTELGFSPDEQAALRGDGVV